MTSQITTARRRKISVKKTRPIALITLAVILLGLFSGLAFKPAGASIIQFNEFQITSNGASQENPDIYGYNIVYQDNRNGNWDIYMYTVQGALVPETRITTNPANQINPKIYGDTIVYQDDRNGNWDIYMYNLTTQTETQITNNTASQEGPAIDGNRIVWQDNRNGNWDIYMYDLSTHSERRVTTSGSNDDATISGNRLAYARTESNGDRNIYCFDLSTGTETMLPDHGTQYVTQNAQQPAICGSRVVWSVQNYVNTIPFGYYHFIVYTQDVVTGAYWGTYAPIVNSPNHYVADQQYPDISELYTGVYYIVYQDNRNGNWDIYLYNTLYENTGTQTEYRLTTNTGNQICPAVYGGYIVYMDNRNGNWDIYMAMVSYAPEPITQPTSGRSPLQAGAPNGTSNETGNLPIMPLEFQILVAVVVIAVIVVSITLVVHHRKHKKETLTP